MREHTDGEFPFANDFNAVVRDALAGSTLVESGCTVSDGGTADLSLAVASGQAVVNGTDASVSSQTVTLGSADPDNPRYDLVVADSSGTASVVAGTASSTPKAPSIPSDSVLLAVVEVPAGASGVTDADIYDARAVLSGIPNDVLTQGTGSGLDADTVDGYGTPLPPGALQTGSGSGLDADTVDGKEASDLGNKLLQQDPSGTPHITSTATYTQTTANWTSTQTGRATENVSTSTTFQSVSGDLRLEETATGHANGGDPSMEVRGKIRINGSLVTKDTYYLFGTPSFSERQTVYLTTNSTLSGDTVTFSVTAIGGSPHLTGYVVYKTGSTSFSPTSVATTRSPVWLDWTPTGGAFSNTVVAIDGSPVSTLPYLTNALTPGQNFTLQNLSWSTGGRTGFGTWTLKEGQLTS